jgi:hypothetical protein
MGCGDDGPSIQQRCEKIVDTVCDRFMECVEIGGGFGSEAQERQARAQCEANFEDATQCERVVRIGPNYRQCLDVLSAEQCSALVAEDETETYEIPNACEEVVFYQD